MKDQLDLRRHFEVLLVQACKESARGKLPYAGAKPVYEFPSTFRAGFKLCLQMFGMIEKSTTELSNKQMEMICDRLHKMLNVPPHPEEEHV
jgi:hypothetical protein|tara:strand:- start:8477 stop:8749 length:273 start_codon:yes stop_codon:yes gene_type:complete